MNDRDYDEKLFEAKVKASKALEEMNVPPEDRVMAYRILIDSIMKERHQE